MGEGEPKPSGPGPGGPGPGDDTPAVDVEAAAADAAMDIIDAPGTDLSDSEGTTDSFEVSSSGQALTRVILTHLLQSGASGCEKGLIECFENVPQAVGPLLQLPCSPSNEVEHFRKHVTKPFSQPYPPYRKYRVTHLLADFGWAD